MKKMQKFDRRFVPDTISDATNNVLRNRSEYGNTV